MTKRNFSGQSLPALHLPLVGGGEAILGQATQQGQWQLVIVYRGLHCPICKKYLSQLEGLKSAFAAAGVELLALSGDNEDKAKNGRSG